MIPSDMVHLGSVRNLIRETFEYGKKRVAAIGAENVFDFSLGNPSVPPPPEVKETIIDLLENANSIELHGYTSAQGDAETRQAIADYLNKTYGETFSADDFYLTVGAAPALTITAKALTMPGAGDEFITFAPYFTEYKVFVESAGAKLIIIPADTDNFQIRFDSLQEAINEHTKGIIINSPNNPSGVVYSEATIKKLAGILEEKSKEYGHPIYLISDEPYRELVYGDIEVPYVTKYYKNSIVCYSFSKSMSMPGERIGYILVSPHMDDNRTIYASVCGAGRALGYICAPSLFQKVIARCVGKVSDLEFYKRNRDLLYNALTEYGYESAKPEGAFYLFVKTPTPDDIEFWNRAKEHEILLVPGTEFACPGYVRIAYCVDTKTIENSLPGFKALIDSYNSL